MTDLAPAAGSGQDTMTEGASRRWEALDLLRGISIIGMLFNLVPGDWSKQYAWIEHAKWKGVHVIDMVAPIFLFCIGAALPLSLGGRAARGATKGQLATHLLWRAFLLVLIGLLLNAYPTFPIATLRIPGVLQKIGLAFALAGGIVLLAARRETDGGLFVPWRVIAAAFAVILVTHWGLLYFVPVPGFGAPRFDPVGSWPAYVDRSVFGVPHLFIWWPVDGKVVYDPDGLLNAYTSAASILLGTLAALAWRQRLFARPIVAALAGGVALIVLAEVLSPVCPIIKNLWTATFVLFAGGVALVLLGLLMALTLRPEHGRWLFPALVYGSNPLLAYILCFLIAPLLDIAFLPHAGGALSVRAGGETALSMIVDPYLASFLFAVIYLTLCFLLLWWCYRRRWLLRL